MNLDTSIKDFLKDIWVGGTLTKFLQEVLKNTGKTPKMKLEDYMAGGRHLLGLIKL